MQRLPQRGIIAFGQVLGDDPIEKVDTSQCLL
jgi:hypothetical protein